MTFDDQDIRWKQRFSNYQKALAQLQKFIDKGNLSELEKQGLIKSFEYTASFICRLTLFNRIPRLLVRTAHPTILHLWCFRRVRCAHHVGGVPQKVSTIFG